MQPTLVSSLCSSCLSCLMLNVRVFVSQSLEVMIGNDAHQPERLWNHLGDRPPGTTVEANLNDISLWA